MISALVKGLWIAVWGPTAVAWFIFEMLVSLCSQFHHANLNLPAKLDSILGTILVTPRYHSLHHLADRQFGDRNFATIFPWWDALFQTDVKQATALTDDATFGLPEGRSLAFSPLEWLAEPFRRRNIYLANLQATDEGNIS